MGALEGDVEKAIGWNQVELVARDQGGALCCLEEPGAGGVRWAPKAQPGR